MSRHTPHNRKIPRARPVNDYCSKGGRLARKAAKGALGVPRGVTSVASTASLSKE